MDRGGRPRRRRAARGPPHGGRVRAAPRGGLAIGGAWRLVDSGAAPGAWNLALDEALFWSARERRGPPTLRLYRWERPTLSIGYAQDRGRDVDLEACRALGVPVLRRASGGRAVLHAAEVTYSVSVPAGCPGFGPSLDEAYRAVAEGLVAGLRRLGVAAALRSPDAGAARPRHPGCFAATARHEITVGGRKLVGSAQRREGGAFLQHGSVLLEGHGELLGRLLRAAPELPGPPMVGLDELLDPGPGPTALGAALAEGCAAAWGCDFVAGAPDAEELREAARLERGRYGAEEWNAGRRPLR